MLLQQLCAEKWYQVWAKKAGFTHLCAAHEMYNYTARQKNEEQTVQSTIRS